MTRSRFKIKVALALAAAGLSIHVAGAQELKPFAQFLNVSSRLRTGTGNNVLIGGFIITGTDAKKVLVRVLGPSLSLYGVAEALPDPIVELHDGTGAIIAANDNWKDTQQNEIAATNLAPA